MTALPAEIVEAMAQAMCSATGVKNTLAARIMIRAALSADHPAVAPALAVLHGEAVAVPLEGSDDAREEIARILETVARDGLPGPRDLDVALDAIFCTIAASPWALKEDTKTALSAFPPAALAVLTGEAVAVPVDAVSSAYHEGFREGMREQAGGRGGKPWRESKAKQRLAASPWAPKPTEDVKP